MGMSKSRLYKKARAKILRARVLVWAGLGLAIGTTVYFFTGSGPSDPVVILGFCIRAWIGASICIGVGRRLTETTQKEYTRGISELSYESNCRDCKFVDHEARERGEPWCTTPTCPEQAEDGICLSREIKQLESGGVK